MEIVGTDLIEVLGEKVLAEYHKEITGVVQGDLTEVMVQIEIDQEELEVMALEVIEVIARIGVYQEDMVEVRAQVTVEKTALEEIDQEAQININIVKDQVLVVM